MTAFSVSKLTRRRKSDKARLEAAKNLEDTSRRLVLPARPAERIRPSHGGFVQYYSPDDVGRSSSTSSASDLSSVASIPTPARSQSRHGKQQSRPADRASSKKSSFSWRGGWHPDRKGEAEESWRGGWPGSEHISEWRAHLKPADRVVSWSSTSSTSDSASSFGTPRSHPSFAIRTQSLSNPFPASDNDSVCFVGCQEVEPESPESIYSAA
jgi:hypothetical protein